MMRRNKEAMNGTGKQTITEAIDSSPSDGARQIVDGDSFRDIRERIRATDDEFLRAKGIVPKTPQRLLEEEASRVREAENERGREGEVGEGGEDVLGQLSGQERVTPTIQDFFPIPTSVDDESFNTANNPSSEGTVFQMPADADVEARHGLYVKNDVAYVDKNATATDYEPLYQKVTAKEEKQELVYI